MINLASLRYSHKLLSVDITEYWYYRFDKLQLHESGRESVESLKSNVGNIAVRYKQFR